MERAATIQVSSGRFPIDFKWYKNKITIDYETLISIGHRPKNLELCQSRPLRDFEVKMDRFQIKQNALNLKSTLETIFYYLRLVILCDLYAYEGQKKS